MKRAVLVPLVAACLFAAGARAEENGLGGFFSHLFGGQPQQAPAVKTPDAAPAPRPGATVAHKPRKKPAAEKKREAGAPTAPAAPANPPPQASKFVYVLGDSLAISAADGLTEDFEEKPEIGVIDRARDASGLVRDDYFDWVKTARDLVGDKLAKDKPTLEKDPAKDKPAAEKEPTKEKIDYVIVLLGINDMQPMRDGKDYVDPLSERWRGGYAQRIQAVVAPLSAAHVPVAWVGLPPMRSEKFNAQAVELNQILKENAEKAGAKFVDIFDAFADQSGGFDAFGPNIEGQKVKLRSSDGIHFTAAGGKKLAHFLDEEILKALDDNASGSKAIAVLPPDIGKSTDINEQIRHEMVPTAVLPETAAPTSTTTPEATIPPAPEAAKPEAAKPEAAKPEVAKPEVAKPEAAKPEAAKPEAGAVASLATRPASVGAALVSAPIGGPSEAERILRLGEPPHAAPGRADDFSR